ncbi:MAG: (2Fe-2S)-binding protein [Bdellovibrionales bacterium]|nr:(2Fe-2S)-binding protein [Bdellovibrionales bacterium]
MFICICKGISSRQLDQAIESCGNAIQKVQEVTGAGTDCGKCLPKLCKLFQKSEESNISIKVPNFGTHCSKIS